MTVTPACHPSCLVAGSINIDEFYTLPHIVRPGETISSTSYHRRGGGKGANQAVSVARAAEGAASVRLEACIGPDGADLLPLMRDAGVDVSGVDTLADAHTGRAIIQLSADGENSIVLFRGANYSRYPSEPTRFEQAPLTHLVVQNEIPFASTLQYLALARGRGGVTTIFNPSPMPTSPQLRAFPWGMVDWLLLNEGEAGDIVQAFGAEGPTDATGASQGAADMPAEAVRALGILARLRHLPPFAAVSLVCTLGAVGVVVLPAPVWCERGVQPTPIFRPAAPLRTGVKDTTGAGDCFTGYFVAGLMRLAAAEPDEEQSDVQALAEIIEECLAACSMCVERPGAAESVPARGEVLKRMGRA